MSEMMIILSGDDMIRLSGAPVPHLRALSVLLREADDWEEVVDGIDDLTVRFDPLRWTPDEATRRLSGYLSSSAPAKQIIDRKQIELVVRFGGVYGPDMELVCQAVGLSEDDVIASLLSSDLYVDMMGFVPGFAYIRGVSDVLNVPRLKSPRKLVPAGSLGLAAGKCGTYALEGPGGWPLIGRIMTPLFSPQSDHPFLLEAGCRITFAQDRST